MSETSSPLQRPENTGFMQVYNLFLPFQQRYLDRYFMNGNYPNGKRTIYFRSGETDTDHDGLEIHKSKKYHREQSYDPETLGMYIDRCDALLNRITIGTKPTKSSFKPPSLSTRIVAGYQHSSDIQNSFRNASVHAILETLDLFGSMFPPLLPALHATLYMGGAGGYQFGLKVTSLALGDALSGKLTRDHMAAYAYLSDRDFVTPMDRGFDGGTNVKHHFEVKCAAPHLGQSIVDQIKLAAVDISEDLQIRPDVFSFVETQPKVTLDETRELFIDQANQMLDRTIRQFGLRTDQRPQI